jgi:hypothetical protein
MMCGCVGNRKRDAIAELPLIVEGDGGRESGGAWQRA